MNKENDNRKIAKLILFYMAYIISATQIFLYRIPIIKSITEMLNIVAIIILISLIIMNKYTKKQILIMIILSSIAMAISYKTKSFFFLKNLLIIFACKDLNFNKFVKVDFVVRFILYLSVIILNQNGLIESHDVYRITSTNDVVERKSLGFSHPNFLGSITFILCCEWLYIRKFKIDFITIVPLALGWYVIYGIANSRSAALVFILLLAIYFALLQWKSISTNKIFSKIITYFPIICFVLSMIEYMIYLKEPEILNKMDENVYLRAYFISEYINKYDWNLFGTKISGDEEMPLDNAYFYIIIHCGILAEFIFIYYFCKLFKSIYKDIIIKYDKSLCIITAILISFLILGLSESAWINVVMTPFLILFSNLFNNKTREQ